jgi:hypothetical protein
VTRERDERLRETLAAMGLLAIAAVLGRRQRETWRRHRENRCIPGAPAVARGGRAGEFPREIARFPIAARGAHFLPWVRLVLVQRCWSRTPYHRRAQMAAKKKAAKKSAKKSAKKPARRKAAKKATKRKPSAAFMKPMKPSAALAEVVGSKPLPRTEVTKKLWAYIKRNGLQDKKNRRNVNADAKLRPIFRKDQVTMFEMTKLVSRHLS